VLLYAVAVFLATTVLYHFMNPGWVDLRRARILMTDDRFQEALPILESVKARGLQSDLLDEKLGEALLRAGRGSEVIALLKTDSTLHGLGRVRLLAGAYAQDQRPEGGLAFFEEFLKGQGQLDAGARLQYASLLRQARRDGEAEAAYAMVTGPESRRARLELAEMQAWQGRFGEAIPSLRQLVEEDPSDRAIRLLLARVLTWSGDYQESQAEYRKLLSPP